MVVTMICIVFSDSLHLSNLTLPILFDWYSNHPFLFMLALSEIVTFFKEGRKANETN